MIVGEAINKATREEPRLHGVLPEASEIVGLRNRIVHGYAAIRDDIIWDTVQNDLPVLRRHLDVLLSEASTPGETTGDG